MTTGWGRALGMMVGLLALGATSACGHKVNVGYTMPAEIDLPADVQRVVVVNRALPKNAGESLLDAAEGWATGEGFETDHDTTELALQALLSVLDDTERFEIVPVVVSPDEAGTSLFDKPMDSRTVKQLCRRHDCDAIVSLDSLDTDSAGIVVRTGDVHEGQTDTSMNARFRVYDGETGYVLDEARLGGFVSTDAAGDRDTAIVAATQGASHQADLSYGAGLEYGMRIAPHDVMAQRAYYKTGDARLRDAKRAVKAGRWREAKQIWRDLKKGSDATLAAKATYNLAVAAEVEGRLERAHALAQAAARAYSRSRTHGYAATMDLRLEQQARLEEQLR